MHCRAVQFSMARSLQVLGMRMKPYVPDFTMAFEHFCIHPGGKAVIEEVWLCAQAVLLSPACLGYVCIRMQGSCKASHTALYGSALTFVHVYSGLCQLLTACKDVAVDPA